MTTSTATRKPKRPTRTVKVIEGMTPETEVLTVRITEAGVETLYDVTAGLVAGRYKVWLWRKVLASVYETCQQTPYVVDTTNELGDSCDCQGYRRWGRCKHVAATKALTAAGKLPALESVCETCGGLGGPAAGDLDSDGCCCRSCGE